MQLTDTQMVAVLTDLTATDASFDPAKVFVGVATTLDDHGAETVQADVTYATGAMATRQAITTWGDPYKLNDGRWAVDGPLLSFRPASSSEAQALSWWTLSTLATAGVLRAYQPIAPPASLADEFAEWSLILRLTVDPNGKWSAEIAFNG